MYRSISFLLALMFSLNSCSDSENLVEESKQNQIALFSKETTIEGFEYFASPAIDLLDLFVIYGYDSGKFKVKLIIEGESLKNLEETVIDAAKPKNVGLFLDIIATSTDTIYEIKGNIIRIRANEDRLDSHNN